MIIFLNKRWCNMYTILLNETNELIKEFPNTLVAAKELNLSPNVIVQNIRNDRLSLKVGRFMSKADYEKKKFENKNI